MNEFTIRVKVTKRNDWEGILLEVVEGNYPVEPRVIDKHLEKYPNNTVLIIQGHSNKRGTRTFTDVKEEDQEALRSGEGAWIGDDYMPRAIKSMMDSIKNQLSNGRSAINILAQGPSGYGKTSIGQMWATELGYDFWLQPCATMIEAPDWFGLVKAVKGSTEFEKSLLVQKMEKGKIVIVLDEINRTPSTVLGPLMNLLDYNRRTHYLNHEIVVGENVVFLATRNVGHQYTGTFPLDAAIRNRMQGIIDVGPLPGNIEIEVIQRKTHVAEEVAKKIVGTMTHMRESKDLPGDIDFSTRSSLNVAGWVHGGMKPREAFEVVITRQANHKDEREPIITFLNTALGVLNA